MILKSFSLKNQNNQVIHLSDYVGKENILLFFYPKDFTPVCTKEVCSFQNHLAEFNNLNAAIFGISSDSVESHKRFADNYHITYHLLSDPDDKVAESFGVKNFLGILKGRETFIYNKEGNLISHISARFSADEHITKSIAILKTL